MSRIRFALCIWTGLVLLAPSVSAQPVAGVVVTEARTRSFPLAVEALGTARANESVELRPKITETLRAIHFEEGERVEAGMILVELDDAHARAAVASAAAVAAESENKYRRGAELFDSTLIPTSEFESLQATRDADRAALDAAQARLAETVIRAPFSGRVGLRRVSIGSLLTPSTIIATLDDNETIKIDFEVPETALSLVVRNATVVARSVAWPEKRFEGHVDTIGTRIDPISRNITVRAGVPNDDDLLRPGMFLTVELRHEDITALMIPEQATIPDRGHQYVLVVGDENIVERREVTLGRRRPGEVEILEGVEAGEIIVVEGTQKARAGIQVEIVGRIEAAP